MAEYTNAGVRVFSSDKDHSKPFHWSVFLTVCRSEADVVFLVDTSSYIGRDDFGKVKNFIGKIIDKLALYGDHSRVAVVTFSDEVRISIHLDMLCLKESTTSMSTRH